MRRALIVLAGLAGAAGVAAAAAAAHIGGARMDTAALMLMVHAPALLGLAALASAAPWTARAGVALALGVALFSGDLAARDMWEAGLFPNAAPIGGSLTILGWLAVAASAFIRTSPRD
ncbi:MAG: DUF423 domain-containing protein [Alphaproteobacteria bacterium]|nr:DUF423 domain-containing protein [Alphaproteobacteria bacterium]MDX5369222.1 DUF423 domain-containing protein [Alphaproteobacteria bacterium]MDX5463918.1 DUF423 domain-containing protein [Alphaproteobacteria bacterium]